MQIFKCMEALNKIANNWQVGLFADDTVVYLTVSSLQDSQVIQSDLDSLQRWERTWGMAFNQSSCQVLHNNPV